MAELEVRSDIFNYLERRSTVEQGPWMWLQMLEKMFDRGNEISMTLMEVSNRASWDELLQL